MNKERKRSHMAVETLLAQTAREVADAKETNETHFSLVDGVSSQARMREYSQMPHLLQHDAAIEWVAWLAVLGLLFTAIWLVGTL
jgi:hypothetical protein